VAEMLKSKYTELKDVKLVQSSGGAFEVSLDGKLIYSKLKTGRFPEEKELTAAVDEAL
jgi:selenoprotein W-related protein